MGHIRGGLLDTKDAGASPRSREHHRTSTHRGWYLVIAASLGLAVVSWATNITTTAQISGEADGFLTLRYTLSKLANSGTAWAGLGIACGWFVRRPWQAAAAGIAGSLLSLFAHYAMGRTSGMFDATVWAENSHWFAAALIFGGPLALVGAGARRSDMWGLVARLAIPVGAVLEPFVVDIFTMSPMRTWPDRFATITCGVILIVGGLVSGAAIIRSSWLPWSVKVPIDEEYHLQDHRPRRSAQSQLAPGTSSSSTAMASDAHSVERGSRIENLPIQAAQTINRPTYRAAVKVPSEASEAQP